MRHMTDGGRSLTDIARRLEALMATTGRNQSAFAELVGITQPAMSNYLKGFRRPQLDEAIKIASKTGVTLDWIYLGDRSGLPSRLLEALPDMSELGRRVG